MIANLTAAPEAVQNLERARDIFIQRWGEMGDCWGINRTMAEIQALLYLSSEPLCTDDIMERLQISRGNASMNLRGLVDWGLINRVHKRGDRKEYFTGQTDVWAMFETIARQRKKREIEPVIETISDCLARLETLRKSSGNGSGRKPGGRYDAGESGTSEERIEYSLARLHSMLEFLESLNRMFDKFLEGGPGRMKEIFQLLISMEAK